MKIKRMLNVQLPPGQSCFLFGARKTGKSTFLKEEYPESVYYDLLHTDVLARLATSPHLLRRDVLALSESQLSHPIIIDEIQKVPELLDEVHWLIENTAAQFILCGSSARKLRRSGANLLGGRAWDYSFYPLVYKEVTDFDLLKALNQGLVPSHYLTEYFHKTIKSYVNRYLIEEIREEGLVRSLPSFSKFLDAVSYSHGQLINYSNIARDCGVSVKTVQEYYQILVDTLVGYFLYPYTKKSKRSNLVATPKFYLFDVGVISYLTQRKLTELKGPQAGEAFEHFIFMELIAYKGINDLDFPVSFWRTSNGLEVDFILGDAKVAVEVKVNPNVHVADLKGLLAFKKDHPDCTAFVVAPAERRGKIELESGGEITLLPWEEFVTMLWAGEIISD